MDETIDRKDRPAEPSPEAAPLPPPAGPDAILVRDRGPGVHSGWAGRGAADASEVAPGIVGNGQRVDFRALMSRSGVGRARSGGYDE